VQRVVHRAIPNSRITARSVTGVDRSAFCSTGGSGKPAPKNPEQSVEFGGLALAGDLTTGQWAMTWSRRRQE
jgi:hypothetical protein